MVARAELTDATTEPNAQMTFFIKRYPSLKLFLMQIKLIIKAEFYTEENIVCQ